LAHQHKAAGVKIRLSKTCLTLLLYYGYIGPLQAERSKSTSFQIQGDGRRRMFLN